MLVWLRHIPFQFLQRILCCMSRFRFSKVANDFVRAWTDGLFLLLLLQYLHAGCRVMSAVKWWRVTYPTTIVWIRHIYCFLTAGLHCRHFILWWMDGLLLCLTFDADIYHHHHQEDCTVLENAGFLLQVSNHDFKFEYSFKPNSSLRRHKNGKAAQSADVMASPQR